MSMYVVLGFAVIVFILFLCRNIIENKIIKKLREMNGGVEHPLYSKDGITINTHNAEYQDFLIDIEGEDDPELKRLKIYNIIFFRITIAAMIITFIMAAIYSCTNK